MTRVCALLGVAAALIVPPAANAATSSYDWGANYFGALGLGVEGGVANESFDTPRLIGGLGEVTQLAAGEVHGLAASSDGTVAAWGANGHGQLGDGATTGSDLPTAVPGVSEAVAVAAGGLFSLALNENGTVEAWGANQEGQLGLGSHSGPQTCGSAACSTSPIAVSGLSGVREIAANGSHALALLGDGTVVSWGVNTFGQIGDGTTAEKDAPVAVPGISEAVAVAAGTSSSLALLRDGEVRAWGRNNFGQLGNGTTTDSAVPVTVAGLSGARAIAAGRSHALALLEGGTVMAWGEDVWGELGNGKEGAGQMSSAPVPVSGLSGVTAIAAGGQHSFALLAGGIPETWGGDEYGELGDGRHGSGVRSDVPVAPSCGLQGLAGIASGYSDDLAWGAPQELCPVVEALAPAEGPGAGGTEVTITGIGLAGASQVLFGSGAATSITVESPTQIRATAPAGSETVDVRVITAKGESASSGADRFAYTGRPSVTLVEPRNGEEGSSVEIHGTNLGNATGVDFGAAPATSFEIEGSHEIIATAPAGQGSVDVTVTNPSGTSEIGHQDLFVYEEAPEYGRCKGGGGNYNSKSCNVEGETKFDFEWYPAFGAHPLVNTGFTLSASALTIESTLKTKIVCGSVHGTGQFVHAKATTYAPLVLTGCGSPTLGSCRGSGDAAGEIQLNPLTGRLGLGRTKTKVLASVQLSPASGTQLAAFECGTHTVTLSGSLVSPIGKENVTTTSMSLKAKDKKGVQEPSHIEGAPEAPMQMTVDGGASKQAGFKATLSQSNEEAVEINTSA